MRRAGLAGVLVAAAIALGGCGAQIDVYGYRAHALPEGMRPYDALSVSLRELRSANFGDGSGVRRARVSVDGSGVLALIHGGAGTSLPLRLSYRQIATHVRAVTSYDGRWTVHLGGFGHTPVELEFGSQRAVRLFLDAATALASREELVAHAL